MNVVPITTETPQPAQQVCFEDFWALFPRHEAKKDALKAWSKLTQKQQMDACIALTDWRRVFLARESAQFIPLPASWIRGERWEDELPQEFRRPTPAAHQAFKPEAPTERKPMPEKLRAMLAELKRK